jgi:hypothetical protein
MPNIPNEAFESIKNIKKRTFSFFLILIITFVATAIYILIYQNNIAWASTPILPACLFGAFRCWNCLNGCDIFIFSIKTSNEASAKMSSDNSPCLKLIEIKEFFPKSKGD